MLTYERFVPDDAPDFERALINTVDHVRGHLSACVDPDDDEFVYDELVRIVYTRHDTGTLVTGEIDADPTSYVLDAYPVQPEAGEQVIDDHRSTVEIARDVAQRFQGAFDKLARYDHTGSREVSE